MKTDLVVKDNALINASYNLEVTEQRLILLAIIGARETGQGVDSDSKLFIKAIEYTNQFSTDISTSYEVLKSGAENLFNRYFSYKYQDDNKGEIVVKSRWVSQIGYIADKGELFITFAPAVVPFITRLEEQFTSYQLKQVAQLKSKYAIRLYEILIAWREVGKCTIKLDDLRFRLGVEDNEYVRMSDFKIRVLDTAIKQINEYTDISVQYDQQKSGRVITGFIFKFKIKQEPKKIIGSEKIPTFTDKQRHLFASKLSELPEMGKYSQGTESYQQFAFRISKMLLDKTKLIELLPNLKKVGYDPK
jgi:plasmid replication initiation protein